MIRFSEKHTILTFLMTATLHFVMMGQCNLTAEITTNPGPPPVRLCPGEAVTITAEPTGGTSPYQYLWGDGNTNQSFTVNIPFVGPYFVTVTDAAGCTATAFLHVKAYTFAVFIIDFNVSCAGAELILAYPDFPAGTGFLWSTGETTNTILAPNSGTYSITVTDPTGSCTASNSLTVTVPNGGNPPSLSGPAIYCPGGNNVVEVLNPGDYSSFLWSTGATGPDITINGAGTFSVTVTDLSGCSSSSSIEIAPNLSLTGVSMPSNSCNAPNGSIDLNVDPFSFNYTFLWSNGESTEDLSNLSADTYTVTVTDLGGCSATASFSVGSDVQLPNITATTFPATCGQSNGAIDITVTPPGSYDYLWSNGNTVEDLIDVDEGTYTVTATDVSSGCSAVATAVVQNSNINIGLNGNASPLTSCLAPDGAINISITPPGAYTFEWSNGAMTEDLTNLTAGAYSVTVSAGGTCTTTGTYTVLDNTTLPSLATDVLPSTCELNNGAIDLSVTPNGSYSFQWSNGQNSEDIDNAFPGIYSVTVTNNITGCTAAATSNITNDNINLGVTGVTSSLTSCDSPDGTIDITPSPQGSYTYDWSNGAVTEDLIGVDAGIYTVTVSAGGVCNTTETFIVQDELIFPLLGTSTTDATCGDNNGAIDLDVQPTASYTFLWSNAAVTEDLSGLSAGTYTVTVTGAGGCTSSATAAVSDNSAPFTLSTTSQPNTSCVTANGAIDLSVSLPGTYTFLWSNAALTEDLSGLSAGSYTVTVTGAGGCTSTSSAAVSDNSALFTLNTTSQPSTSCVTANGAIDLIVSLPGTYTYLWSNAAVTEDLSGLSAGTYTVTVTGINGCTSAMSQAVPSSIILPELLLAPMAATCGQMNGGVSASVSSGSAPYSYLWSSGSLQENLSNIFPGSYSLTITDSNGCTAVSNSVVSNLGQNFSISATTAPNNSCTSPTGNIDISVPMQGSYVYLWSTNATTQDLQAVGAGIYSITVTDNNGCSTIGTYVIDAVTNQPNISVQVSPPNCDLNTGTIEVSLLNGGTAPLQFSIDGGATFSTLEIFSDLPPGNYPVLVLDANGCSDELLVNLPMPIVPVLTPLPDITLELGELETIQVQLGFPIGLLDTVIWEPVDGLTFSGNDLAQLLRPTVEGIDDRVYTVTLIARNGCEAQASFQVKVNTGRALFPPNVILQDATNLDNSAFTLYTKPGAVQEILMLKIFDRWGSEVFSREHFEPNIPSLGWSGDYKGKPLNPAVFVWWAKVSWADGTESIHKGDVTVLR